jgi:DNA-binding transcriptional ArsR family regulator
VHGTTTDPVHPGREDLQLADVLHALSDPVRLQLVEILGETEGALACIDIPLPVGKSTASHHLRVLREAGVARCRVEGTRRFYSLRREDLEARFPGVLDSVLRAASSQA